MFEEVSNQEKEKLRFCGIEGYIESVEERGKVIAEYMHLMEYHRLRAETMMHFPPPWGSPKE